MISGFGWAALALLFGYLALASGAAPWRYRLRDERSGCLRAPRDATGWRHSCPRPSTLTIA